MIKTHLVTVEDGSSGSDDSAGDVELDLRRERLGEVVSKKWNHLDHNPLHFLFQDRERRFWDKVGLMEGIEGNIDALMTSL